MAGTKKSPQRQCIGCRELRDKKELLRVVKTPDNTFVVDTTGRQNGRGAYVCRSKECFMKAVKTRGLERSFKMSMEQEIYDKLEKEFDGIE